MFVFYTPRKKFLKGSFFILKWKGTRLPLFLSNCFFSDLCSSPSSDLAAAQVSYNSNGYFRITGSKSAFPPQKEDKFAIYCFQNAFSVSLGALNTPRLYDAFLKSMEVCNVCLTIYVKLSSKSGLEVR